MRTAYISHDACLDHDTGDDHPECRQRLTAIEDRLIESGLRDVLVGFEAPDATRTQLQRAHTETHIRRIEETAHGGRMRLDPDTVVGPDSAAAARRAAGAAVQAVDLVMGGSFESAFCGVRPPGHHAERGRAMGFCLYNNVAVGAAHVLAEYDVERVAIVDFDVHHGNGTEDIFRDDGRVLFCSTFQHPFYPFTPLLPDSPNRVSVPLAAGSGSDEFRSAVSEQWLPALEAWKPEILFVSAGFDAHVADEMSHMHLVDDDYRWVTEQIVEVAAASASNRIVSALEGGYELHSLARCTELHLRVLMGLH